MDNEMNVTEMENTVNAAMLEMNTEAERQKQELEEKKKRVKEIWKKQLDSCFEFFDLVAEELKDIYEVVPGKSKQFKSACLVPKGTASQVTYYGKPLYSLRVASNWNWRAGLDRCSVEKHIQCVTPDLPYVKPRPKDHPDWSSPPVFGNMVAIFDSDRKYHCLFGEKYNKDNKTWTWMVNTPKRVAAMVREKYMQSLENPLSEAPVKE